MVASGVGRHLRRTAVLRDFVEREEALARACVRRRECEATKIFGALVPAGVVDAKHRRRLLPELLT
jgi:hypothetical protein